MSELFKAGEGALWVQPDGPNTTMRYLGCHEVGDVDIPEGDKTLLWCKDPSGPNRWQVKDSFRGAPGTPSTTITTDIETVADYLESLRCPASVFIVQNLCGRQDVFGNWDRIWILSASEITNRTLSNLVAREPDNQDRSTQVFSLEANDVLTLLPIEVNRQTITSTQALNDVIFCNVARCVGYCGPEQGYAEAGYAVGDYAAGASPPNVADVLETADGGVDGWPATAADPFAASEDIASVTCVEIGGGVTRVIVARGTTDVGNPMEIAYSDDDGVTWTNVNVGAVNGQYATMGGTLFSLDMYHIWLATTGGYVYFSDDAAVTWTAQTSGGVTAQDLNHIDFVDEDHGLAVGDSNAIIYTDDGGETWELITGPTAQAAVNALACDIRDQWRWWVAYADGELWYTHDGSTNWAQRDYPESGDKVAIRDITFVNDDVGWMIADTAAPVGTVYRTANGGTNWLEETTPTNAGLNAIWGVHNNLAYIVGEDQGGTGVILRAAASIEVA